MHVSLKPIFLMALMQSIVLFGGKVNAQQGSKKTLSIEALSTDPLSIDALSIETLDNTRRYDFWLSMGIDIFGREIQIPVIVIKGAQSGPTIGITAAIHGNEVNGVAAIHRALEDIDPRIIRGTILAIPGLNPSAIYRYQREHEDGTDLNRIFPGDAQGNESEQLVAMITKKILPHISFLVDLHTASFGRENSLYARGDLRNPVLQAMMEVLDADIILASSGGASTGVSNSAGRTLRTQAALAGVDCITIELGNPQVFQLDMIERGARNIHHIMTYLKLWDKPWVKPSISPIRCQKSYWLFTDRGGLLEMKTSLSQLVEKGQELAILRNMFGHVIQRYYAPEKGVIIGQSTNPINNAGGRIVHLGILE